MADETPITFRTCSKCGVERPFTTEHFRQHRRSCRECDRAAAVAYYHANPKPPGETAAKLRAARAANPERYREYDRRNYEKNKAAGSEYQKKRYQRLDKEAAKAALKKWRVANPDKQRAIWKRDYEKNKPKHRERVKRWQQEQRRTNPEFREKAYEKNRQWRAENRDWVREDSRKKRVRRKDDPAYKIMGSVRARLNKALKGRSKSTRTAELLGAPVDVVKAHIQSQFTDGMTWANWGRGWRGAREWHLDHIKSLASFDLTDPEQLAQACHYTNLQPLWAVDNLKKGHSRKWQEMPKLEVSGSV